MNAIIEKWRRRYWRRDAAAIAALPGDTPALVVTGGSDGIGLALAMEFASPDRTTVLIARGAERLEKARSQLLTSGQGNVLTFAQDVCAPDAPARTQEFLATSGLYTDILINSAGIGVSGDFSEDSDQRLTALADLNVTALTRLCHAFLPAMLIRGQGGIINVSSLGGFAPGPYQAAYYASKSYVNSLTRALAHETRGMGVRITVVAPGPVNTEFHRRANAHSALYRLLLPALSPERVARSTRRGYALGLGLVIPGLFNNVMALAIRLLPDVVTMPIIAILLKPRRSV